MSSAKITPTDTDRRAFLKGIGAAGALALAGFPARAWAEARPKSVVASAHRPGLAKKLTADAAAEALNAAVAAVTGKSSAEAAWRSLFDPGDIVGVKLNCLTPGMHTHAPVARAIVRGLRSAGVPENHIVLWDMRTRHLQRCGYTANRGPGVRCHGTDGAYDGNIETVGPVGTLYSSIVARTCNALVNVPVLKDHNLAGVTIGLKNFYGAIHNPNKYHGNHCDPYIACVNAHRFIRGKLRLTVCDAVTAQYNGGPGHKPRWAWPMETLLVSRDTVALDTIGAGILEAKRKAAGLPSLQEAKRPPLHIASAAKMKLGTNRPEDIRLVKV
jgi:uncharacterized protein (DUF362 family)